MSPISLAGSIINASITLAHHCDFFSYDRFIEKKKKLKSCSKSAIFEIVRKSHATRKAVEDWALKLYFLPRMHCMSGGIQNGGRLRKRNTVIKKLAVCAFIHSHKKNIFKLYGTKCDWYLNVRSSLVSLVPELFGSILQLGEKYGKFGPWSYRFAKYSTPDVTCGILYLLRI